VPIAADPDPELPVSEPASFPITFRESSVAVEPIDRVKTAFVPIATGAGTTFGPKAESETDEDPEPVISVPPKVAFDRDQDPVANKQRSSS